jgi:hypothetical protein
MGRAMHRDAWIEAPGGLSNVARQCRQQHRLGGNGLVISSLHALLKLREALGCYAEASPPPRII